MASPEDSAVSVTSDTEALLPGDSDQNEPEKLESTAGNLSLSLLELGI